MNPILAREYTKLMNAKDRVMTVLSDYNTDQLNFKPSAEEWSMLQVMHHLVIVETLVLANVKKGLQHEKAQQGGLREKMSLLMMKVVMWLPTRIKAPMKELNPPEQQELAILKNDWNALREDWQYFLEKFPEKELNRNIFKHPIAGMFNMSQALSFMTSHIEHHLQQIDRIKKDLKAKELIVR